VEAKFLDRNLGEPKSLCQGFVEPKFLGQAGLRGTKVSWSGRALWNQSFWVRQSFMEPKFLGQTGLCGAKISATGICGTKVSWSGRALWNQSFWVRQGFVEAPVFAAIASDCSSDSVIYWPSVHAVNTINCQPGGVRGITPTPGVPLCLAPHHDRG
jgi:hypothetical protein